MKKFILAAAAMVLTLGACTTEKSFKLTGSGFPAEYNGQFATVADLNNNPIDSVEIKDGGFVYTVPANDTLISIMSIDGTLIYFSHEAGDFTIAYAADAETGRLKPVRGGAEGSAFMKLQAMENESNELATRISSQIDAILPSEDATAEPTQEQMDEIDKLYDEYQTKSMEIYKKYYTSGGNSVVDLLALLNMSQTMEASEFVELYNAAGSVVKNYPDLKKISQTMEAAAATSVGKQFLDYEITNPAGESQKLSDFRAEGKYFLLDFFASWCGPCKASMPILSEIEKEFASVLTSASIAVWENDQNGEAYAQAVKDFNITWSTFQDATSEGVKLYGVQGVPTFILFSPEGEILLRGHNVEEVRTKLVELTK